MKIIKEKNVIRKKERKKLCHPDDRVLDEFLTLTDVKASRTQPS